MDLNPAIIASVFCELIKLEYPEEVERRSNSEEQQIAKKLMKRFNVILNEYTFEHDTELVQDENVSFVDDNEWRDDAENVIPKSETTTNNCTLEKKIQILDMINAHPDWKIETIRRRGGFALKDWNYKKRWEAQVEHGGTLFEKYTEIDKFVYNQYLESRSEFKILRGSHLKRWALIRASQFTDLDFNFKASETWIESFKRRHKISSRKITHLVSKREVRQPEQIMNSARKFQDEIRRLCLNIDPKYVYNTDQVGFQYELISNRTLSNQGEKLTFGYAESPKNKVTHSYTVQYIINKAGDVIGDVFVCLREPSGKLGPTVQNNLIVAPNVQLTCSKSGKLSKSLVEYFLDTMLVSHINDEKQQCEKFVFLVDSWSAHIDPNLYTDRFGEGTELPECILRVIPEKCTPICQPLDTTFHRQLKYLAREIHTFAALENEDETTTRNNIIRTQSLLHHQISAPIFKPMIQYSWYSSGLTQDRPSFQNMKQVCFSLKTLECEQKSIACKKAFIQCSRCRKHLCFQCFFWDYHALQCTHNDEFLNNL